MIARNVIDKCNKEQMCEMKVAAAIKTTIWRTSCAGQAVGTNFIQVNYTCVPGKLRSLSYAQLYVGFLF